MKLIRKITFILIELISIPVQLLFFILLAWYMLNNRKQVLERGFNNVVVKYVEKIQKNIIIFTSIFYIIIGLLTLYFYY